MPGPDAPTSPGWRLMGQAALDHHRGAPDAILTIVSDAEEDRRLPAAHFFRGREEMPEVEQEALRLARGRVLDVGACAGAHTLALQARGLEVTALEVSSEAVGVMRARGIADARRGDLFEAPDGERWDTVLILMNGTTLVGSPAGLTALLESAAARLAEGGSILIDSTDVREGQEEESDDGRYIGEVQMQVAYQGERSDPFPVLYAHPELMTACAEDAGLAARVVFQSAEGAYLAEVTKPMS